MKKLLLILFGLIIFVTSNVFASVDTNITKVSKIWVKNNSNSPLTLFVERIETLLPEDSTVNYFCWGACYPPSVSISGEMVTIPPGEIDKINFIGDYIIKGGAALIDTAQITYCFIDDCDYGNFKCFTAFYSLEGPNDSLYQMLLFDSNGCDVIATIDNMEQKTDIMVDNRMFDVSGKEFYNYNEIPFGTLFIQNGKKYIKIIK